MNSETLSFRTIINELDLIKKQRSYYLMKHLKKKDLSWLASKSVEKIPDPHNAKEHYQSFVKKEKRKINKAIRDKYLSTKTFWKPKHFRLKIGHYRTFKNFA